MPQQTVALTDGAHFHRLTDEGAIAGAYRESPRTRVFESAHARSDGWYSLVALYLANALRREVICTLYASSAGDLTSGRHVDRWDGVILQVRGTKVWRMWPQHGEPYDVATRAGDVLLLPQGVVHEVTTPLASVHAVFAVTQQLSRLT